MDFITDLPPSGPLKATNLLVITDLLSKGIKLTPMKEIKAENVAKVFLEKIIPDHGIPRSLLSDRGRQFARKVWGLICKSLGVTRRLSTAYHPETDGATERMNAVVEPYLRSFCTFEQDNWAELYGIA